MLRRTKRKLVHLGIVLTIIATLTLLVFFNSSGNVKGRTHKNDKVKEKKRDTGKKDDNSSAKNKHDARHGNYKKGDTKTDDDDELNAAFKELEEIRKGILNDGDDTEDNDELYAAFQKLAEIRKRKATEEDVIEDYDAEDVDYAIHAAHKYHRGEKEGDTERGGQSDSYEDDGEEGDEDEEGAEEEYEEDAYEHADPDEVDEEEDEAEENYDNGEEVEDGYGHADDNDLEEEEYEDDDDEDEHYRRPTARDLLNYDEDYDLEDDGEEFTYYAESENTIVDVYTDDNNDDAYDADDDGSDGDDYNNDYHEDANEGNAAAAEVDHDDDDDGGYDYDGQDINNNNDAPGEMGTGVYVKEQELAADDLLKYRSMYRQHGFNGYVSDMIAANRSLPDIRNKGCKRLMYDIDPDTTELPTASVIICFHNEALSVLLRTVVSVLNQSPSSLLEEIILVDDNSTLGELSTLNQTLSSYTKVRLIRTSTHEGLIRARLLGVQHAKAPALVFLDSHVECFTGWLEPLLDRLTEKQNAVVCPQIQTISEKSFKIMQNDQVYVGNLILSDLSFDWLPVQARDRPALETEPIRSPTFAGGLFAILKTYFEEIGGYDEEMDLWGGENLEMSFKVWMCGGSVEVQPCSNVAHLFRKFNPLEKEMDMALTRAKLKNNLRVAEVWLDEYIKYYNEVDRMNIKVTAGNTSKRRALKEMLRCESFQWYIDHIYPGIYISGEAVKFGKVVNEKTGKCLTSLVDIVTSRLGVSECNDDFFQVSSDGFYNFQKPSAAKVQTRPYEYWQFSKLNALQRETGCAAHITHITSRKPNLTPTIEKCNGGRESQYWMYTEKHWLYHQHTETCMASTSEGLQMLPCEDDTSFVWIWLEMEEPRNPFVQ